VKKRVQIGSKFIQKHCISPQDRGSQPCIQREPAEHDPSQVLVPPEPSSSSNQQCHYALAEDIQNLKLHIIHLQR